MLESADAYMNDVEALMARIAAGDIGDMAGKVARQHLETGGKRLRARLGVAAVGALGGDPGHGVGWGAACEMLHNATLIHDDLQDGDEVRRGRPTVWVSHGMPHAINGGDLLLILPFAAVEHVPVESAVRWEICRVMSKHAAAVIRGQSAEMELTAHCRMDRDGYVDAITGKTSGLFQLPVEGAALISGRSRPEAEALARAFQNLGRLFQMQDDVIDLFGDKGRESAGSDLREGKVSALVVEHVALHPDQAGWLEGLLTTPRAETSDVAVAEAIERFRTGGALQAVLDNIRQLSKEVERSVDLEGASDLRELARELIDLILEPISHVME